MSYKFENTVGGKAFSGLVEEMKETIVVSNSLLPESMRDEVRGGRTLKRLEELCDKRDGLSEHVKTKMIKERNIARLAAQIPEGKTDIDQPLDWSQNEVDEVALNRHEIAMVNGMVASGVIDAEDLTEEF